VRQLTGWWKLDDGTLIHESNDDFARMRDSGKLDASIDSPDDLLRHLSRGTELTAYGPYKDLQEDIIAPTAHHRTYGTSSHLRHIVARKAHHRTYGTSSRLLHIVAPTTHHRTYGTSSHLQHIIAPMAHHRACSTSSHLRHIIASTAHHRT